jgi:hypothetical protein
MNPNSINDRAERSRINGSKSKGPTSDAGKAQYSSLKNISVLICSRAQPLVEVTHEHEGSGIDHLGGNRVRPRQ